MGSLQPLGMAPQTGQRSWHLSLLLPIMASYGTLQWYGCILELCCGMAVSHRPITLGSTAVARPRSPCLCSTTTPSRLTSILRNSPYLGSPPAVTLRGADRSPGRFQLPGRPDVSSRARSTPSLAIATHMSWSLKVPSTVTQSTGASGRVFPDATEYQFDLSVSKARTATLH